VPWRTILAGAFLGVNACASAAHFGPAWQDRPWRTYLGSERRATAIAESIRGNPQPVWRTDVGRGIVGAPALTEDVVALSQVDRQVTLLDRSTGEIIWRHRVGANLGSGPLVDYDRLYVASQTGDGEVMALDLRTGRQLWATRLGDVAAPLSVRDSLVFAGTVEGWIAAISTARGARVWRVKVSGAVRAAPLVAASGVVVATTDDSLFLLDAASGAVRVRRGTLGTVLAAPALADSLLLVGSASGRLEACDTATLAGRWHVDLGSAVVGSVAVQQGTAYTVTARGDLWEVPLAAPERAHSVALGMITRAGPTPVAGGAIVAGVNGELALIETASGARPWTARVAPPVGEPVTVDGRMLVAVSGRGEVVAFR
jgi:outer membrane protein assembly factor BamB